MATDLRRPPAALDSGSFDRFYRRHLGEIYRFVLQDVGNRADAEEVTQTAFLDAFRALRRGHEPEMPRAWMYGIARNATRRRYRTLSRRPREVELEAATVDELAQPDEGPWAEAVRAAFARLRPNYRDVLFLREVEGLSYVEIAARLNLSQSAVETLLFRARRALREHLEAEGLTPLLRKQPVRSLKTLTFVPAVFLGRLSDRLQQALSPDVASKAVGALTVVALGTGVAVGTTALPADSVPERPSPAASAAAPGNSAWNASPGWLKVDTLVAATERDRRSQADTRQARGDRTDGKGRRDEGKDGRGGDDSSEGGSSSSGAVGVGDTSAPAISVPGIQVAAVPDPTQISTPAEAPSVDAGAVAEVGGVSPPAVDVPDVEVSAVPEVPQVSTPPVATPPVELGDSGLFGG